MTMSYCIAYLAPTVVSVALFTTIGSPLPRTKAAHEAIRMRAMSGSTTIRDIVFDPDRHDTSMVFVPANLLRNGEQSSARFLPPDARSPRLSIDRCLDRSSSPRQRDGRCIFVRHDREDPASRSGVAEELGAEFVMTGWLRHI
jgi:hypothetical protein